MDEGRLRRKAMSQFAIALTVLMGFVAAATPQESRSRLSSRTCDVSGSDAKIACLIALIDNVRVDLTIAAARIKALEDVRGPRQIHGD
jgi:hypothetical protein